MSSQITRLPALRPTSVRRYFALILATASLRDMRRPAPCATDDRPASAPVPRRIHDGAPREPRTTVMAPA